jgi:thymidylate synthase
MHDMLRHPVSTFDCAYRDALRAVIEQGAPVAIGPSKSTAAGRRTYEMLNYAFELSDCRARVASTESRPFNVFAAVGRFAWLLSGSSLVADIEFYDHHARAFSDDGVTVPGSSDGARLIAARPGNNQIHKVLALLRRESNTRRAAIVIYSPEDVGRESVDIPCTIALTFNLRDDELHTTVIMRANNALTVLPYDVFQFSMLAELIAAELGVLTGRYHHFAASMHIYADDLSLATDVADEPPPANSTPMPAMPRGDALAAAYRFIEVERSIRTAAVHGALLGLVSEQLTTSINDLGSYWSDLARIVLVWAIATADDQVPEGHRRVADLCATISAPLGDLAMQRLGI